MADREQLTHPGEWDKIFFSTLEKSLYSGYNGDSGQRIEFIRKEANTMKYICNLCGWVYDEEETGIKWEDLPEDFVCELCGAGKEDFSLEE